MAYIIVPQLFTDKIKALIYGDPGAGKTFLAGTCQDHELMRNVRFLNIDGGMMTLAERGDIEAVDIHGMDELEAEGYKIANREEEYSDIKTVVLDNITELQTLNLEDIVEDELSSKSRSKKDYTIDDIFQEDYGKSTKQMARIIRMFRDLPINVICIAHRRDRKRKNSDQIMETRPKLTEQLCTSIMGYMDFVWFLYAAEVQEPQHDGTVVPVTHRFLLTQPYDHYLCKTRGVKFAEKLGTFVTDPTFPEIMDLYLQCGGIDIKGGK